ncbi:3-keto-disaccharide hydrolase [Tellurirhabdus bombi]|uniref:3-keto-disaccharide hydrolase n=1 Tax=Tellurirhabdus bombi TaxID=2907205 RepID=UPI001F312243|nr:DUF1080 domain-containing protein [Tellurirhabdus bombi]
MKKAPLFSLLFAGAITLCAFNMKPGKWISLFDGKTTKGWHSYLKNEAVGWNIEDGTLTPDGTGGDLVTDREFENFEFDFEFKVPKGSNSGVVYKVIESPDNKSTHMSGPEYQIIDDKGYGTGEKVIQLKDSQLTGSNYDMQPPSDPTAVKPAGEWNKGRIVVNNDHVEHYVNGKKVVEYHYGGEAWKAQLAKSKFTQMAYATPHAKGKIALQSHNPKEKVWYRNLRIREL